jgi:hypothetical protein
MISVEYEINLYLDFVPQRAQTLWLIYVRHTVTLKLSDCPRNLFTDFQWFLK